MNQPTFEYSTPNGFPERSKVTKYLFQLTILAGFLALVILPLALYGCRTERARWTAAEAMNLFAQNETDAAFAKLRQAVDSSSSDNGLRIMLAEMLALNGQATECLRLCDEILESEPSSLAAIQIKSDCQQQLERPLDALATAKSLRPFLTPSQANSSTRRNNLAYYRALANTELDVAREDMLTVLRDQSQNIYWSFDFNLSLEAQAIISIAQLSRKLDRQAEGEELLDTKIIEFERLAYLFDQELLAVINENVKKNGLLSTELEDEVKNLRVAVQQKRGELAVFLVLRALRAQETGDEDQCDKDRLWAKQLGFDPDELARLLPTDAVYLQALQEAWVYLDTYGYVLYRTGDYEEALTQLDLAVLAGEYHLLSLDSPLRNSSTESPKFEYSRTQAEIKKTLAATYYHRMLVHRELSLDVESEESTLDGAVDLEEADANRIRSLGFDPSSLLY